MSFEELEFYLYFLVLLLLGDFKLLISSSLQISQNKLKNENQQVQQNGDQAKKTSSVRVFLCSLQVFFTLQDQKTSQLSAPRPKNAPYATKKQNKITKKEEEAGFYTPCV